MNVRHAYVAGFALTIGTITYYDVKTCKTLPWPPRIVASALVFGILDLFSILSPELAGIVAIGIVLASLVNKGFTSNCDHAQATTQAYEFQTIKGQGGILQ